VGFVLNLTGIQKSQRRGDMQEFAVAFKQRATLLRRPSRIDWGAYGQSIADVNAARTEVSPNSAVARSFYDVDAAADKAIAMEVTTEMAAAEVTAAHMNATATTTTTTTTEVRTKCECGGGDRSDRERSDSDESELAKHFNLHL
jgi:hypothetical protein